MINYHALVIEDLCEFKAQGYFDVGTVEGLRYGLSNMSLLPLILELTECIGCPPKKSYMGKER